MSGLLVCGPSMMSSSSSFFLCHVLVRVGILVHVLRRGDEYLAALMQACVLKIRDILVDERD